ncbi:MAG: YebG family protein [Deltaproteobacteria bacterium]|nr:YebG family protein [Candidatus Tharpella aukensis]
MAVIVQYIVVRNGEQKMTFTSKKEADAYDKLLDVADQMYTFLQSAKLEMNADQLEELSFYLAKNRETAVGLLRGGKAKKDPAAVGAGSRAASGRKTAKTKKTASSDAGSAASKA